MEDLLAELVIAILATAVVTGSLFVCNVLYKLLITQWRQSRDARALARTSPDADSGEQPLPQAEALPDMEVGPMNSGEALNNHVAT